MSQATKIVVGTVAVAAVLSLVIVANLVMFAA